MYKTSTTIVSIERSSNIKTKYRHYIQIFILKCIQDVLMGGIYIKIYIWKWAVLE